jgi:hypothetical protein
MAGTYGFSRTAQALRVNYHALKRHVKQELTARGGRPSVDGIFLWLSPSGSVETWFAGTGGGTTGWGSGNNVNSDANVQVFGNEVPEPTGIVALLGLGGMGLIGLVWRCRKAA